ncbi:MAG: response regulator transcription factor [Anaerolineales bacterium]|nr:response regulator transcription factor [Anaerolineales bacterium]
MRVLLADDHAIFREGLCAILDRQKDIVVVGEARDGVEAVKKVAEVTPDIVLMDINMPVMDGVRASRLITAQDQRVGIIILTMYREDEYVFEAIKAGARGYVVKDARAREVLKAIRAVHRGEALIDPAVATKLLEEFRRLAEGRSRKELFDLNEQETEILRLVAQGASNKEIAAALFLSEQTIKNKLSIVFQKLHVNNRAEAVTFAIREGLISMD